MNLKDLADSIGKMVSERLAPMRRTVAEVADSLAGLARRLDELEARELQPGPPGEPGPPGRDAEPVEITHDDIVGALRSDPGLLQDVVAEYLRENPPAPGPQGERGQPGSQGEPGKDAEPVADEQITRAVAAHLAANPPAAGEPGPRGEPGADAAPVADEQVSRAVSAYLAANPPAAGEPGKDGVGVAGATINRGGNLVLMTSDGRTHDLGPVIGKDGRDWEGAELDFDGEKSLILRARDGAERIIKTAIPRDRGYWRNGTAVEKGDLVTHDGSLWIAQTDTDEKPGYGKDAWRLAARKGRDGTTVVKYADSDDKAPVKLKQGGGDA